MIARERRQEYMYIVHSLQSAGANVDVKSTREWTGVHIMRGTDLAESHETGTKQESKKIDPKELLESAAAGKDKSKSDDQKPPVVNEFFPKLEDLESEEKMIKKYSTHLTKEEQQEFIEEVNVILVTATSIEYRAVMGATAPTGGDGKYIKVITKDGSTNFILGKYGRCNVAVIMTEQGPDNTQKVLTSVLDDVKAEYVIAIGICYGAKESKTEELGDKTKLANIIVAKSIVNTEHQRSEEKRNVLPDTYHCGEKLLNLFKHEKVFNFKDKSVKVHVGVLASEFTLHRNEEEKQKILKQVPQALGGEMEANGINRVAVAKKDKFQWIVIKSIVDWGNEDKDKTWQPFGAVSCARFVLKCLKDQPDEGDPLKKTIK
ncbi:PREDICTED: uncharacterized protein LOC109585492 isoform X1 [Amphimedon queenslandica]|uniref:Nucleoside phosphorylase domain-containing protein n=1 Tax=Amphimedon queenslandica TaxID=400682 RepID=A0AAN0JKC0_AMPQE|nr:PREDICTED: uncharacterized protein LOC109585492 isoform X1 [Amphimedon queenslandica]|eukprot:XP_019857148.1 PREDICTED: uncharacterized protein LOC109585492 isoform X1 [Amphimedon queenslandica]